MKPHSGSILFKLQVGFALAAMVLAALLALFMDGALRRSLEAEDAQVMEALIRDFRRTLVLGVVLAVVAAALVARVIARWGLAPLGRIVREVGAISDRNLDRRLAMEHFPRELQELVATLNATLSRLQEAFDRVSNLGAELAHELRTPLQNLRSTLENRALRPGCPETEAAALGELLEECDRMGALIEQILFLARMEDGPSGLACERIPVRQLLEEVEGFFEGRAEEAGVRLQVAVDPAIRVDGERLLLTRALHNLTANALDHAAPGGRVALGAAAGPEATVLWVEDDGPGIPADWISRLGTPFVRPPGARKPGGLGLGLAIVKRIAGMLGGSLRIDSRMGEGTRVEVRIPHRLMANSD